jgi:hypothetical protein
MAPAAAHVDKGYAGYLLRAHGGGDNPR